VTVHPKFLWRISEDAVYHPWQVLSPCRSRSLTYASQQFLATDQQDLSSSLREVALRVHRYTPIHLPVGNVLR